MRIVTMLIALCALAPFASSQSVLRWKLDIQADQAKVNNAGRLELNTSNGKQVYYYFVYTVASSHDEAIPLHLHARAKTDSSETEYHEGYYPSALKRIREKFGADVKDSTQLSTSELAAGGSLRAVAVFQFRDGSSFDDTSDSISLRFSGFADPVKKRGLTFTTEKIELWQEYEKKGDAYDAHKEPVKFVRQEEKIVG